MFILPSISQSVFEHSALCLLCSCNLLQENIHSLSGRCCSLMIVWVLVWCRIVRLCRRFGRTCCLHLQGNRNWFRWMLGWLGRGNTLIVQEISLIGNNSCNLPVHLTHFLVPVTSVPTWTKFWLQFLQPSCTLDTFPRACHFSAHLNQILATILATFLYTWPISSCLSLQYPPEPNFGYNSCNLPVHLTRFLVPVTSVPTWTKFCLSKVRGFSFLHIVWTDVSYTV